MQNVARLVGAVEGLLQIVGRLVGLVVEGLLQIVRRLVGAVRGLFWTDEGGFGGLGLIKGGLSRVIVGWF